MDSCCELCQTKAETSGHWFWSCSNAQEVWKMSKLFFEQMTLQFSSFMDLMWYVVTVVKWENESVEKIMMVAWAMWNNRNKFRNGGE